MSHIGSDLSWYDNGLCKNHETSFFYPEPGDPLQAKNAKIICRGCPVKAECLTFALENKESFGIWGGYSPRQRTKIRRIIGKNISISGVKDFLNAE